MASLLPPTSGHAPDPGVPTVTPDEFARYDNESRTQKAVEWHGTKDIRVNKHRRMPLITDSGDALIRITATCICGSDLHMYNGVFPGMRKGDSIGHEFMGVVEKVGPDVMHIREGDRVVACFDLGCNQCFFCKKGIYSGCEALNPPSKDPNYANTQEKMYGDRTGGIHGYSCMTGGWEGGQCEYKRVPLADVNLLKVPEEGPDEKWVFLSDILPTAWHANEMGEVKEGDTVAIWGAGPVGILAAHCAFVRGAARVLLVDEVKDRLKRARDAMPNVETIDFSEHSAEEQIREKLPHGPDVGIEAVGFHYVKSWYHKAEMTLGLETDPSELLNGIIRTVRKGGIISDVGVYSGYTNHFNIGAFMEKGLTMRGGQTPVQKYWHQLLKMIEDGTLQPSIVLTHEGSLEMAPHFFKIFDNKEDGCIKVRFRTARWARFSGKCVLKPAKAINVESGSASIQGVNS